MAGLVTGNAGMASYAERGNDLYETPEVAVRALLEAEYIPNHVWEPACGRGAIVSVLRESGRTVWASDVYNYGNGLPAPLSLPWSSDRAWFPCPDLVRQDDVCDFLAIKQSRIDTEAIVTNPPFKLAEQFVEHAIALAPKVVMLLRLAFLESERRTRILESGKLARVYVFRNRLPMMHRDGWDGNKVKSGSVAFAWFVWDRFHKGPAELRRISWRKPAIDQQKEAA